MESILIVEDDAAFADYLWRGLTYEGYQVRAVPSAEEGLAALRLAEPRAVILDLMLPGMDGLTACASLRQSGYAGPVLMLTARDGIGDRVAGLDAGADDYLVKPFEFDELLARLRALRRRCQEQDRGGELVAGDISLDAEHLMAHRAGRPLALTRTELELLAALIRPPRGVRTRDELIAAVWGLDFEGEDKVLDMAICRLRAKLGQPNPIHTLPGVGYRFASSLHEP